MRDGTPIVGQTILYPGNDNDEPLTVRRVVRVSAGWALGLLAMVAVVVWLVREAFIAAAGG